MGRKAKDYSWPAAPPALPSPVIDNHTHLESLGDVLREGVPLPSISEVISDAARVGVSKMIQVGCDLESARVTDSMIREHAALAGAIAIHPNEAPLHTHTADVGPDGLEPRYESRHDTSLDDALAEIERIARSNNKIRAIGETGIDLFRAGEQGFLAQKESFRAHIALAKELNLAMQIHDRDAHQEVIDVLLADGAPERTVFHCFSGDAEMADLAAQHGWYLSFAGPVTFGANNELREALRRTPTSHVLVETDAPYLTPHPYRGRPNAPYLMPYTVHTIAHVQELNLVDACQRIVENTHTVYGLW
ncbi:TatD family hydrolase [Timonella sp. A28]|uniref:TatD family hydrolase n=1 Tax=Timonella sp. A28 TaxID=3442640 RepID=UPI003EBD7E88